MKQILLLFIVLFFSLTANAQTDTTNIRLAGKVTSDVPQAKINIYPVPVREGNFTIKSDRDITEIKITNIIGQDIYREHFDDPGNLVKITLDNPGRGIYLCAIYFSDGTRSVKKIMVEKPQ